MLLIFIMNRRFSMEEEVFEYVIASKIDQKFWITKKNFEESIIVEKVKYRE
jgi:hypothetical protein